MSDPAPRPRLSRIEPITRAGFLSAFVLTTLLVVSILIGLFETGRPRVSPVIADLRTVATALELYHYDHGVYPEPVPMKSYSERAPDLGLGAVPPALSTPVAYLSFIPNDPMQRNFHTPFAYQSNNGLWILWSPGIDGEYDYTSQRELQSQETLKGIISDYQYDPTNGVQSRGDLFRIFQPHVRESILNRYREAAVQETN